MFRSIKRLYYWNKNDPVDEDLRGWSWEKPPVKPRAYLNLGVYEVAGKYCPTRRDIWIRRKLGIKPENTKPLVKGKLLHEAMNLAVKMIIKNMVNNDKLWRIYDEIRDSWKKLATGNEELDRFIEEVYKSATLMILGELEYESLITGSNPQPPVYTEYKVDGTPIGLAPNISVDALSNGIIVEYKYGEPRDFHVLSIAGYALALEAEYEVPFDYGLLVYVYENNNGLRIMYKPVYVSNMLRRWFIDERNTIIDMLIDNNEPPTAGNCRKTCPFYKVCHP